MPEFELSLQDKNICTCGRVPKVLTSMFSNQLKSLKWLSLLVQNPYALNYHRKCMITEFCSSAKHLTCIQTARRCHQKLQMINDIS